MRRTIRAMTFGLVVGLGGACAPQAKVQVGDGRRASVERPLLDEQAERGDAQRPPAAPSSESAPPASPTATPPPTATTSSEAHAILRAELTRVLDGAPGRFLARIDSEPRFRDGRFHGWRLRAFFPGDPRFARVDLRPGDVVVRVNGQRLERPDDLFAVWTALRTARELVVELERDGAPRTLRWTIVD
jgi:type II secretory pathway component PulC